MRIGDRLRNSDIASAHALGVAISCFDFVSFQRCVWRGGVNGASFLFILLFVIGVTTFIPTLVNCFIII